MTGGWCTATSSRTTSSRPKSSSSSSTWAECGGSIATSRSMARSATRRPRSRRPGRRYRQTCSRSARALAVLTFEFKGYQSSYKFTFPDGVPLLAQQESFARLLRRATNADPGRRFGSAGEMAEQLTGVLREVARCRGRHAETRILHGVQPRTPGDRDGDDTAGAALGVRRRLRRSSGECRCHRWTGPTPRPATWPRSPGLIPASEPPRCPEPSPAIRPCPSEVATSAETRLALARARLDVGD